MNEPMRPRSISWKQGYDQGFADALVCEENGNIGIAISGGEQDWSDGYYEGHVAGESASFDIHSRRYDDEGDAS